MTCRLLTATIVAVQLFAAAQTEDYVYPKVKSITPHDGSYEGGTRLYIHGEGFSSSGNFGAAGESPDLGNKAYFVSDFESVPCDVENDASHETMIVCYTRPMRSDQHYFIQVVVDGFEVPFNENCNRNGRSWYCRFIPRWYRTPYIRTGYVEQDGVQYPMQTSFAPGGLITVTGRIFTQIFGSNNQTNENGRTVSIRRAYIGGQTCDLLAEPDVFHRLELTSGDEGVITCKPKSTFIGPQNFSLILTDDYGRAQIDNSLMKVNGKNKVYNFQTYAEILSVTPDMGSLEGGTRVVIEGRFLDDTTEPVQIMIGRIPCDVIPGTLTTTKVECFAGNPPSSSDYFPGSRGVNMELWDERASNSDEVLDFESSRASYNGSTTVDSTKWRWNDELDDISAKSTGVFVVPEDDNYMFMVAGDDLVSLFVNCEGSNQNLTKVAYTNWAVSSYHYNYQKSDWIPLLKGQECYFEAPMVEHSSTGYIYIAVQRETTTLTSAQSVDAKNEIQYIDFQAKYEYETQVLNFTGWSSQAGAIEVQEVVVQHTCIDTGSCEMIGFRLSYEGVMTTFIKADASQSSVKNALEDISELKDENIAVSATRSFGSMTYTVEFRMKRGDYSPLTYVKYPASVQGLTISIREVTKGVSEQKTFKLRLGGRATPPISQNFDATELQSALDETRSAYCPDYLLPDRRKSTVVTTVDYETIHGWRYGEQNKAIEPFCGRTSMKNCDYIYYAGRTADNEFVRHSAFDATVNKWLCLAHRGLWYQDLHLSGTFKTESRTFSGNHAFSNPIQTHATEWRYSCIDLMEVIHARSDFADVYEVTLSVIRLIRKSKYDNFYIDALTIGSSKVTDDIEGVVGLHTPPALANGKPIEEFIITKAVDAEVYTIKIDPYDCGDQLPLITMPAAFGVTGERTVAGVKPMSGYFDLTVNLKDGSYNMTDIPVDISTEEFEERLESEVPGFGEAKVWRQGGCHARDYRIEWYSNGGNKPQMEVRMQDIRGASDLSAHVSTQQNGGIRHHPIPGDMLRLAYKKPQVEVFVNGYPSKCVGSCQFETSESATPVISGISPSSGSSASSTVITITGTNLGIVGSTTSTVTIGDSDCSVTSNTATSITCILQAGSLGTYDLVLNVGGKGFARKASESTSLLFTISGSVSSINPNSGFKSGGTLVTIGGYGFSSNTVFTFDSSPCEILSVVATEVKCRTPSYGSSTSVTVSAMDGAINLGSTSFTYTNADAEVVSINPTTSTLNGGSNATITGVNIGQSNAVVMVGEKVCDILESSDNQITCKLPPAPVGVYDVKIMYEDKGYADGPATIAYNLEVNNVSPLTGSRNGGNTITITGTGFSEDNTMVKIGDMQCKIQSITSTMIECVSGPSAKVHLVTNNGRHATQGTGYAWDSLVLHVESGDTVTWKWEFQGAEGGWEWGARVFTTATASSDVYDEVGFESSPDKSEKGSYSYTFNNEGTYFVSSGKVDHPDWGSVEMKQSIIVEPSLSKANTVNVTVGGYEAEYNVGGAGRRKRSTCTPLSTIPSCTPSSVSSESGKFSVVTDECYSPKITAVSVNEGYMGTEMKITGEGFASSNCANKVVIGSGHAGEYGCTVTSSTSAEIMCTIAPEEGTPIYTALYVDVEVLGMGKSSSFIVNDSGRRFTLLPSISSISPTKGSLSGGTLLTISGSGFSSDFSILVGFLACNIETVDYFEIKCRTSPSTTAGTVEVTATVSGASVMCTSTCNYMYDANSTPQISSVSPSTVVTSENTELTLTGTSLSSDTTVTIGSESCAVSTSSATSLTCTIAQIPAGVYFLQVQVPGVGNAQTDPSATYIVSSLIITSMSPVNGSKEGGTTIEFTGNGFTCLDIEVKVGSKDCVINTNALTNFQMECVTVAQNAKYRDVIVTCGNGQTYTALSDFRHHADVTPEIHDISPTEGAAGSSVTINGALFDPSNMKVMIGDVECSITAGADTQITCVLQEHAGGEYPVTANVIPFGNAESHVYFNYSYTVSNTSPDQGSFAGGNLLTLTGTGFSGNAMVYICDSLCDHGNNTEGTSSSYSEIICKVPMMPEDASIDKVCDVTVSVNDQSIVVSNSYTYASDRTPKVTTISPARGGTQGGTTVTITGTLFDSNINNVNVEIGGVVCDLVSVTVAEIRCTTNAIGHSLKADVLVTIAGKGKALTDVQFYYIDVWSSQYTWGGNPPPQEGEFVVVPASQTLLIDEDTPVLKMILIQGGTVIFDEKDIHLQTENILITDGGVLQIGTEDAPFEHKAIITLHGHLRSRELPIYGTKTIGVRNGTLDLHGKHVPITWTHLSQTATAGTDTIHLKHAVTWNVGDEIVLATTGLRHTQRENEKHVIKAVSNDGTRLTFESSLSYTHISVSERISGMDLETHGEVGLLTRNIVIRGSTHMEWSKDKIPACPEGFDTGEFKQQTCFQGRFGEEEGSDQFGAQIMIHHRAPGLDIARARIEYVELTNMGQAFRLGRYPIHFHLLGDVNFNNYVRGCAIHKSFNRAITIHNTHHLLIEHNVIYDIMGGAVFIEDGIEHGNKIEYNLVVFCKQSTSLQNDDITPAAFWVTNPNNTLQHNAAAGGTHFGFWYRIHETPDGPSADSNICQQLHPLQKFANNTVHSHGWFGLWVFQKYFPRGDGSCGSTTPTIARFDSMSVWNCEKGAELVNVGAIQFWNFVMYHNEKAGIETKLIDDKEVKFGQAGTYNSTIIAYTSGLNEDFTRQGMILPFTEGYEVIDTEFVNFDRQGSAAIGVTSIDGTCTVLCGGWEAQFSGITFENSANKAAFRWEHEVILRDMDGSLSGTAGSLITPYNPSLPSSCTEIEGFGAGEFRGMKCDNIKKFHRVSWNNPLPTSLQEKNVLLSIGNGSSSVPFRKKRLTHPFGWMSTMADGETYQWTFEHADQLTNISYEAGYYNFGEDDCVIVSHNLTQKPDKFVIAGDTNDDYAQSNMVTCGNNYHGDYYFDTGTFNLYYVVSGRDRVFEQTSRKKRAIHPNAATPGAKNRPVNFRVYRCFYLDCIPPPDPNSQPPARVRPDTFQLWHTASHWKINENDEYAASAADDGIITIPPDNKDIRIEQGTWMVVKQSLPKMNKLWIEGVLEIEWNDPSLTVTLSATHIMIMGGRLIVGWEDSAFRGLANIVLRGNHNTQDVVLNGGVVLGSKAIGVIGGLDLHGKKRSPLTTHLASQLTAGQSTITLEDTPFDWEEGDEIVIAGTGADPWETETFKVSSIVGNVVTLNDSARFDHIAESFSHNVAGSGPSSYDIRAEVSILTRNVKIIGEEYDDLISESFGARVLVAGVGDARGYARISNVEFFHTGQEGWIDNYDPRYSLAFLNSGTSDIIKPSDVRENTFHNGFNTAIGVFGSSGFSVSGNVIHHTVGPAIRIEGTDIRVEDNLAMLVRTRSVYLDRTENDLLLWKAAIEVNLATRPVLQGNVVVGSERAGYRIKGHNCGPTDENDEESDNVEWGWNTARAVLHGVWMNKDGFPLCSHVSKFRIHSAHYGGIYYQSMSSAIISDVLVTDSRFAITPIVYSPSGLSHAFMDKTVTIRDSTIVAVSKPDYCNVIASETDFLENAGLARPLPRDGATALARTGILWPVFLSNQNAAPSKPFVGSMSYPAIGGRSEINGVSFVNFGDTSCSSLNTAIMTNLKVEDFLHPMFTSGLEFVNSPEDTLLYLHRPSIGAINPSDCVDMECDGMKKALIVDRDGTLVGGTGGSVIPQAEYEWDGDARRGLGDYRIPKTLLTRLDGSRIPVEDIAPNKGILRANSSTTTCIQYDVWQAHKCTGYHHGILIIESLDADTETRRLSPVALLADEYIDLNNGPQDHGWCNGYTCQERLSTFWTIVAFPTTYELHFSGTSPEKIRLRIPNEDPSTKMVLKLFIKRPQRLDVFTEDTYTPALNYEDGVYLEPNPTDQYHPSIDNSAGSNYFDRQAQIIHIVLQGGSVVEIREAPVVVITFNMPAVTPDEFFDNGNLIGNLAAFLGIPASKIRIVDVIREGGGARRRRNTGSVAATVEIGDSPEEIANATSAGNTTSENETENSLSYEELQNVTATITNALQQNELGDALGATVNSMAVVDARAVPARNANITNATETDTDEVDYFVPDTITIVQQPSIGNRDTVFSRTLKVAGVDASGNEIVLGHSSDPWQGTVTIVSSSNADASITENVAYFNNEDGHAEFENMTLSHGGEYILRIQVTYPSAQSGLTVETNTIIINEDNVGVSPVDNSNIIVIVCSVVGGLLVVSLIVVLLVKGPFFRANKIYEVNSSSKSSAQHNTYLEIERSANPSTVNVNNEAYEETPPNSVTDLKENLKAYDNRGMTPPDKPDGHL